MDTKTKQAVHDSAEAWMRKIAATDPNEIRVGKLHCPLCTLFNHSEMEVGSPEKCKGCPVREKTGQKFCDGSPYEQAFDALQDWRLSEKSREAKDRFRRFARREVNFLRALLTEEGK